jgi:Ca-activated chloride channel family protein
MLIVNHLNEKTGTRVTRHALRVTVVGLTFLLCLPAFSQKERTLIREGNKLYENGKYKDAEMNYRKAIDANKNSTNGLFNLGDAVYQQKNFEESSKIFGNLAGSKMPAAEKASVLHNLGNSLLEAKDYEKSILAYQNSLIKNPSDKDTKYNLEYAKMMLKKQQEQQKKDDQQKKDQQKKDKQDKKDQKQNDQNKDQKQDKKDQQDQTKKISKEDADRMLEAMKKDEKKTLQKVKKEKMKVQQVQIEKDW